MVPRLDPPPTSAQNFFLCIPISNFTIPPHALILSLPRNYDPQRNPSFPSCLLLGVSIEKRKSANRIAKVTVLHGREKGQQMLRCYMLGDTVMPVCVCVYMNMYVYKHPSSVLRRTTLYSKSQCQACLFSAPKLAFCHISMTRLKNLLSL